MAILELLLHVTLNRRRFTNEQRGENLNFGRYCIDQSRGTEYGM
jgi:hypothetical protein